MKRYLSILLSVLMLTVLSVPISADTVLSYSFEDACSSLEGSSYRTTANLISGNSYLQQVDFPALTDKTGFELEDFSNPGEVIYYIENPSSVSVSLYRNLASFAILYPDGTLAYNVLPDSSEEFQLLPLWVDVENGSVYCCVGEKYYQLFYELNEKRDGYFFTEEPVEPAGAVRPYGLSIQTSSDGATFDTLDVERTFSAHYTSPDSSSIFDETFHADLPADCRYLKIQAEQYPSLRYIDNGIEGTMETLSWYKVILRHVSYTAVPKEDGDWSGALLPEGSIGDTSYGEKDDSEDKDKKPQSSKDSKSSSSKSSDAKNSTSTSTSTTTSSTVEHSSSSTTTDSNNSTSSTSYTTNYYFYNFSEETAGAIEQILTTGQPPDLSELEETEGTENSEQTESTDELPLETVVMDNSTPVPSGESGNAVSPSSLNISPDSEEDSSDSHPFLIYVGLALIILFQIIIILRRPSASSESQSSRDE